MNLNIEETSDKPKLRHTLDKNLFVIFKSVKVMKIKNTEELFHIGGTRDVTTIIVVKLAQILLLKGHDLDNRQNLNGVQELDVSMMII